MIPAGIIFLLMFLPVIAIALRAGESPGEYWQYVRRHLLPGYMKETALLLLYVSSGVLVLGTGLAWLVSAYEFTGRRYFEWLFILPLGFPAYMMAHSYVGILEYTGPLSSMLRNVWGIRISGPLIDIMNTEGAGWIMALSFYPYVYVLCRSSFLHQSGELQEAAALLGCSMRTRFFRIAFPLARPAIAAGLALACMEALNDYGTVRYFGVETLTSGIFRSWFSAGDVPAAIRLSLALMVFVLLLIWIETRQRGSRRWVASARGGRIPQRMQLRGWRNVCCFLIAAVSLICCFILPLAQLIWWVVLTADKVVNAGFMMLTLRSLLLSLTAAMLITASALVLLYALRTTVRIWPRYPARLAALGYAVPGAVIAIGIYIPAVAADHRLIAVTGGSWGLLLSGSAAILVFAYMVRFMAVGYNAVDAGFQKSGREVYEASRTLGASGLKTLLRVDMPLIRRSLAASVLLVFVDVMKELPLTLILRPFNFHTLATSAFDMATNEMVAESANASLVVVLVCVIPVVVLNRLIRKEV